MSPYAPKPQSHCLLGLASLLSSGVKDIKRTNSWKPVPLSPKQARRQAPSPGFEACAVLNYSRGMSALAMKQVGKFNAPCLEVAAALGDLGFVCAASTASSLLLQHPWLHIWQADHPVPVPHVLRRDTQPLPHLLLRKRL